MSDRDKKKTTTATTTAAASPPPPARRDGGALPVVFCDLNVPYAWGGSLGGARIDRNTHRLLTLAQFGFKVAALNDVVEGNVKPFPFDPVVVPGLTVPSSERRPGSTSAKQRLSDAITQRTLPATPIRQLSRVTFVTDDVGIVNATYLTAYDLIAVQPVSEKSFQTACLHANADLISIDLAARVSFKFKRTTVGAAVARGVHFEICYSQAIADQAARRNIIANARELVKATNGKNIIISSGALSAMQVRGPYDVMNLAHLFGLNQDEARKCLSSNCRSVLYAAGTRRDTLRGVAAMEPVSSLTADDLWKLGDAPTAEELRADGGFRALGDFADRDDDDGDGGGGGGGGDDMEVS
ncbi:RNase P subunit p30-domain-containing protein [Zopfochytrium polystomum]|nr:RNase P subunit p30-domain-containing protein [Zopfochytrium polystomum]